jgi:hypothetical protein
VETRPSRTPDSRNYGASDEWADEAKFEARAVALAKTLVTNSDRAFKAASGNVAAPSRA